MANFQRYAVYYAPDDPALAAFGATWLGWDVEHGRPCQQPAIEGIQAITKAPQKYGFHGTLKPPFRLAEGKSSDALAQAVAKLASTRAPVTLDGLALARLGNFLALVPEGDAAGLSGLAFACVSELDTFRDPPTKAELERRRAAGLSAEQDALLLNWGYPYVGNAFRFHLTLTGKLAPAELEKTVASLETALPVLPRPYQIASIALVGQREDGMFQLIQRHALTA